MRWLALPAVAWTLHALTLWVWHLPALYDWALESNAVLALEHVAFLGTALLFWSAVLGRGPRGMGYGAAVLDVFTMALQSALLGALITFASEPWYASYAQTTAPWGLTQWEDQQLVGAIMWAPAGLVYALVVAALVAAALRDMERRMRQKEAGQVRPLGPAGSPADKGQAAS